MASFSTYLRRRDDSRTDDDGYVFASENRSSYFIARSRLAEKSRFLRDLEFMQDGDSRECLLKMSPSVKIGVHDGLFIKCYRQRSALHTLRRSFLMPRPFRCLAGSLHLRLIGAHTPKVFFAQRVRRGAFAFSDALITEPLPAGDVFLSRLVEMSPEPLLPRLLNSLAVLVADMHASGMEHGDLSLRNLYALDDGGTDRGAHIGLIDLDGCRLYRGDVPARRRRREVARILSSYLRCRRAGNLPEPDYGDLVRSFVEPYENKCGMRLNAARLRKRTEYLAQRIRVK